METREQIGKWYDDFAEHQERTSVNLRHYRIMEFLADAGLKRDSRILEIGCGIGTLTGLILKYAKRGKVVAADISPESVSIAEKRLANRPNVSFMVTDMTDFKYPGDFDFIVLPDVLEHIPLEQHKSLFRVLVSHMHDSSVILIHIPHPQALDYIRENSPDKLQIIDQSVSAATLLENAYDAGLVLVSYTSYPLFDRTNDYAVITLKKKGSITMSPLPKSKIIYRKLISRLRFQISRL
jgi:trans-aconitate 2-methyltransferase